MKLEPPVKTSINAFNIEFSEIEPLLQGYPMQVPAWPEATLTLKDGRTLFIRQAKLEDVPAMLGLMER